jgi:hypothetical protein
MEWFDFMNGIQKRTTRFGIFHNPIFNFGNQSKVLGRYDVMDLRGSVVAT